MTAARNFIYSRLAARIQSGAPLLDWARPIAAPQLSKGLQGHVGILETRDEARLKFIYKISKEPDNYLLENEDAVLRTLEDCGISAVPRSLGLVSSFFSYELEELYPEGLPVDVLLIEYLPHHQTLNQLLVRGTDAQIRSVLTQILLILDAAETACSFTHFDLHPNNIIIAATYEEVLTIGRATIPSAGVQVFLIDFACSFAFHPDRMQPFYGSVSYSCFGLLYDAPDFIQDLTRCLYTISSQWRKPELRAWLKTHYPARQLQICPKSGWLKPERYAITDVILQKISTYVEKSSYLTEQSSWISAFQGLMTLPLVEWDVPEGIEEKFQQLAREFRAIEDRVGSSEIQALLFKKIILLVRRHRGDLLNPELEEMAVEQFKEDFLSYYDTLIRYHQPRIHFGRLVHSVLNISIYLEREIARLLVEEHAYHQRRLASASIRTARAALESLGEANLITKVLLK